MVVVHVVLLAAGTLQSGLHAAGVWTDGREQVGTVERTISSVREIVDICHEVMNSSWVWLAKGRAQEQKHPAASEAC